ncbi:hypothetical protein RDI58_010391 [Solanum bulbocastanum]|uniref:NB-ARC domain-containing protein n=1 Tax=Solanum bulbocastanum TaxID=147425 RepID=A0AAN8TQF1_SOLBU
MLKMKDNELADLVQKNLKGPRYLVVDDIWSRDVRDSISQIFPNRNNGSRILLTTRENEVVMYANTSSPHEMNLLDLDNSWKLLLIAWHLSKTAKTLNSWEYVAQTLSEIIASHPNKCLGVLGLSYHHLPNRLKPCFLSMGNFPEDFQVDTWRLIQLWIAEGFIRAPAGSRKSLKEVAKCYLEDLISMNLVMARERRFNGEVKECRIHDLLREFCFIETEMTKFMHVVRTPFSPTQKPNVRRFSIQKAFLDEYAYKLLPPVARSKYYFSLLNLPFEPRIKLLRILPIYRHDPIIHGFFSRFNLLRVLAIFNTNVRFESFPLVIAKLFHLRYLQIRCFGNISESISELQNLQTLICDGHSLDITLPEKIWMMKNLRYIRLGGASYLPSPRIDNKMPNLEELFSICYSSCTNEVFSSIPNLKRLTIRVLLSASQLIDMSSLRKLESIKFNCILPFKNPINIFAFKTSLRTLSLTDCANFIWKDISSAFIMLPNLEELKLKSCRAEDDVWRLSDKDIFKSLKLLLLKYPSLKCWEASSDNFPNLKRLVLKNCNNLQEIPIDFGEICTLQSIELHNCSTSADESAINIVQEQEEMGNGISLMSTSATLLSENVSLIKAGDGEFNNLLEEVRCLKEFMEIPQR